jgi:DNA (cytosine-5)-methyltransferase 1
MGYYLAGFDVIGVDTRPQREYPFPFIRRDALSVLRDDNLLAEFDAIHASPPCQSETPLRFRTGKEYTDFLTPTLELLDDLLDIPWIVENVEYTRKMPNPVMLCGTHFNLGFGGRILRRHRLFSASFTLPRPGPCWCGGQTVGGVYGKLPSTGSKPSMKFTPAQARSAMGIDWMNKKGLSQAIPPDYTRWVGEQLLAHMRSSVYARDYLHEQVSSGRIGAFAQR